MNPEIKEKLTQIVSNCDTTKYPNICKKTSFKDGKDLVVNMIYNRLEKFPNWELDSAISDVELNLAGLQDE
jgi:hypothetical protein